MDITIQETSLILLIGASGSGKSTFAKKHFPKTWIVSSDECRAIVSDDEDNQAASADAFDLLHSIVDKRLSRGLITVVDATNVLAESRKPLIALARKHYCRLMAIVLDLPETVCQIHNIAREYRIVPETVIRKHNARLKGSLHSLKDEGFKSIITLSTEEEVNAVTGFSIEKLLNNKKELTGPFDIIGDVHGCIKELILLLQKLDYQVDTVNYDDTNFGYKVTTTSDRKLLFVGDLVDRGPDSPAVLKLVMSMVNDEIATVVVGNHDDKLKRKLQGRDVKMAHGLAETVEQLSQETPEFRALVHDFLDKLVSHYVFDDGNLVVAHAGIKSRMQGRGAGAIREFCMYGETTGETDELGLPVRIDWTKNYKGKALVVFGHTPVQEAQFINNTIDIDTGCVFGGKMTALRYPEKTLVSVDALEKHSEPSRPLLKSWADLEGKKDEDALDLEAFMGNKTIHTSLIDKVLTREENNVTALEVMSRFAVNPKWLIYLPPTMSPSETSKLPDYLEHPNEAFYYFKKSKIQKVICEEKHMGSRAIVLIGKNEAVIETRFGIRKEGFGICYTRTGRNFFTDKNLELAFLNKVKNALDKANVWEKYQSDWICLDCELMPWSAKAQTLLQNQYAAVGAAGSAMLKSTIEMLITKQNVDINVDNLLSQYENKLSMVDNFKEVYANYCWEVNSVDDFRLAPFHILATENKVYTDKNHEWHLQEIAAICDANTPFFVKTKYKIVDLTIENEVQEATNWWLEMTGKGGEGMVVKPLDFVAYNENNQLLQPAMKVRGREYLRLIYGAEYTSEAQIKRLKNRNVGGKRRLALQEFALSIESLNRFCKKENLQRVHECVFGLLSLESEAMDPRL